MSRHIGGHYSRLCVYAEKGNTLAYAHVAGTPLKQMFQFQLLACKPQCAFFPLPESCQLDLDSTAHFGKPRWGAKAHNHLEAWKPRIPPSRPEALNPCETPHVLRSTTFMNMATSSPDHNSLINQPCPLKTSSP